MRQSLSPVALFRDGFNWSGRSGRLAFFIVCAASIALACALIAGMRQDAARWQISGLLVGLAITLFPFFGHVMRRLNDLGWSGWWWWVALIPGLNLALFSVLCLRYGTRYRPAGGFVRLMAGVVTLVLSILLIARVFWAPYVIVSPGMKPTVLVSDYVVVRLGSAAPARGDVVAFRHPTRQQVWVSRIVGLSGERVQMRRGVLHINGQPAPMARIGEFTEIMGRQGPDAVLPRCANGAVAMGALCRKTLLTETLPGGHQHFVLNIADTRLDSTNEVTLGRGEYFVLGDNRYNSADSRTPVAARGVGVVPQSAVIGRAERIVTWGAGAYLPQNWRQHRSRFWDRVD